MSLPVSASQSAASRQRSSHSAWVATAPSHVAPVVVAGVGRLHSFAFAALLSASCAQGSLPQPASAVTATTIDATSRDLEFIVRSLLGARAVEHRNPAIRGEASSRTRRSGSLLRGDRGPPGVVRRRRYHAPEDRRA